MSRKTVSLTAIAAVAIATTLFPSGNSAVALAQAANVQLPLTDPVDAAELGSETPITYVSEPVVQPLHADASSQDAASLSDLVGRVDTARALNAEMQCLAGAVYFEARGEALAGQLAVAQVIINRTEDGRFPKSYCGVVSQPGQFSFMRGKQMPAIRTGSAAWTRAVAIAEIAHKGLWQSEAGEAVFFHAKYVRPGWSQRKTKLAQIDTHIFYR
ncbi:cell wall hydrolase [Porphyrobacter sp. LM 6]|uniref:cell wall hydrolase n=1 Tax=Porphyrobacter sp. LM 6 TaxID=1896196 RepID=UPI000846C7B4|nr:cell wall hydrolase [Porphyrobacter sp. LM 6]AOL93372.1 Cell Wall Hydrolase [Porphyrobacter sp. LM 6]